MSGRTRRGAGGPDPGKRDEWPEEQEAALLATLRKGQEIAQEDRQSIEQKLNKIKEDREDIEELRRENRELQRQLERYQYSVPLTVYACLFGGLLLVVLGTTVIDDLIYPAAGLLLALISASAIFESRIRGNRKQ